MQLLSVKFNAALFYVLGGVVGELRQVRHVVEGLVVDEEDKLVGRDIIVERDFPLKFVILHLHWKQTRL